MSSIDIEWISQLSYVGEKYAGTSMPRMDRYICSAWPASCVSTSTSSFVPLKFAKMKGAL